MWGLMVYFVLGILASSAFARFGPPSPSSRRLRSRAWMLDAGRMVSWMLDVRAKCRSNHRKADPEEITNPNFDGPRFSLVSLEFEVSGSPLYFKVEVFGLQRCLFEVQYFALGLDRCFGINDFFFFFSLLLFPVVSPTFCNNTSLTCAVERSIGTSTNLFIFSLFLLLSTCEKGLVVPLFSLRQFGLRMREGES